VNADTEGQVVPRQPRLTNERSRTCSVKLSEQLGKDDRIARWADIRICCNPRGTSFRRARGVAEAPAYADERMAHRDRFVRDGDPGET
jgi:hypothetical protein